MYPKQTDLTGLQVHDLLHPRKTTHELQNINRRRQRARCHWPNSFLRGSSDDDRSGLRMFNHSDRSLCDIIPIGGDIRITRK